MKLCRPFWQFMSSKSDDSEGLIIPSLSSMKTAQPKNSKRARGFVRALSPRTYARFDWCCKWNYSTVNQRSGGREIAPKCMTLVLQDGRILHGTMNISWSVKCDRLPSFASVRTFRFMDTCTSPWNCVRSYERRSKRTVRRTFG